MVNSPKRKLTTRQTHRNSNTRSATNAKLTSPTVPCLYCNNS